MNYVLLLIQDSIYSCDNNGFTPLHYAMGNCQNDGSPGAIETILSVMSNHSEVKFEKHPLTVFADRTRDFKNVSKQGCLNAQKCLQIYLRHKPHSSTNFFTALQSLPQWLQDIGMV